MEYFDVVDCNRKPLNKILPRGTKLADNEFNVGIECLIINSNNELLLTQRAPQKSHCYMCPSFTVETSINNTLAQSMTGFSLSNFFFFFVVDP